MRSTSTYIGFLTRELLQSFVFNWGTEGHKLTKKEVLVTNGYRIRRIGLRLRRSIQYSDAKRKDND